jgi:hypothetical protein
MRKIDSVLSPVRPCRDPTASDGAKSAQLYKSTPRDGRRARKDDRGTTELNQRDEATNGFNTCKS